MQINRAVRFPYTHSIFLCLWRRPEPNKLPIGKIRPPHLLHCVILKNAMYILEIWIYCPVITKNPPCKFRLANCDPYRLDDPRSIDDVNYTNSSSTESQTKWLTFGTTATKKPNTSRVRESNCSIDLHLAESLGVHSWIGILQREFPCGR